MNTLPQSSAHAHAAPAQAAGRARAPAAPAQDAAPADAFSQLLQDLADGADAAGDGATLAAGDGKAEPASDTSGGLDPALAATVPAAGPDPALPAATAPAAGAPGLARGLAARAGAADGSALGAVGEAQPGKPLPPGRALGLAAAAGDGGEAAARPGNAPAHAASALARAGADNRLHGLELAATRPAGEAFLAALAPLQARAEAAAKQGDGAKGVEALASTIPATAVADPSALGLPTAATFDATPTLQADLASRPQDASFPGELAAQVQVMVEDGWSQAELRLNPADLGPIQIQLQLDGGQADIRFAAAHDATREGLARSVAELRDMLAAQGLSLGQAQVDAGGAGWGFGRETQEGAQALRGERASAGSASVEATGRAMPAPRALRGMLDLYA